MIARRFKNLQASSLPKFACWLLLLVVSIPGTAWAGGPENVLLVVNADDPDSLQIANQYIALRNIPPRNVVYLSGIQTVEDSAGESINSTEYRTDIFEPIQKALKKRQLEQQISYIVYSSGFPTRVILWPEQRIYNKFIGKKYDYHHHAPFGSLTSITFFDEAFFSDKPYTMDNHSNWYAQAIKGSRSFAPNRSWNEQGQPLEAGSKDGRRYYLSAMLAVVREEGTTPAQAMKQLSRSARADASRPSGVFYFADHKDPRSLTRKPQFQPAAEALKDLGFEAIIGSATLPQKQNIIGATLGSAKLDWSKSKSRLMPGAFCDNFTSYGAWWEKTQTKATHFLNSGSAATVGMVSEPYTIPFKIPTAFAHVHYARGCTIGESVYQTVYKPYQMLFIGDPLCRPFGEFPIFEIKGIKHQSLVTQDISFAATPTKDSPPIEQFRLYIDGLVQEQPIRPGQSVNLPLDGLSSGYHELRLVAETSGDVVVQSSQQVEIFVRDAARPDREVKLSLETKEFRTRDTISASCVSSDGLRPALWHNGRMLGAFSGGKISVDASKLGRGTHRLFAVARDGKQTVSSVPVKITIK